MEIRKLQCWEEWFESDRIIGTAFLHEWDEKKAREKFRKQGMGEEPRDEEAWGLFNEDGRMQTSFVTTTRRAYFEGTVIPVSEVNMVASLPEARGIGNVRALMAAVLRDFKARGDLFAVLHPFSFAFYRKYGFDLAAENLTQKFPVEELRNFSCKMDVRQARSENDIPALAALYERCVRDKNLANLRTEKDFVYRGNGEFGPPDWWTKSQSYTYIFSDDAGDHAYLKFVFEHGPEGPFSGDLHVKELIFDSPEAFSSALGFIYGMRAKLEKVILEIPENVHMAFLLPECDHVEEKLAGHLMGRVLEVKHVLQLLRQPNGRGCYRIRVEDPFLPENTGTWEVSFSDGKSVDVTRTEVPADLIVNITTFTQLALGLYPFRQALYRPGTVLYGQEAIFSALFTKKVIFAG